jgi:hypothetical protein
MGEKIIGENPIRLGAKEKANVGWIKRGGSTIPKGYKK